MLSKEEQRQLWALIWNCIPELCKTEAQGYIAGICGLIKDLQADNAALRKGMGDLVAAGESAELALIYPTEDDELETLEDDMNEARNELSPALAAAKKLLERS